MQKTAKTIASRRNIKYIYEDALPDDAITVNKYCKHDIRDIYYSRIHKQFYYKNIERYDKTVTKYRVLHYSKDVQGSLFVTVKDVYGNYFRIYLLKFRKLYDTC